ncbi:hypothetical protein [Flavobacterium pectinovorum]|uniref:Uncharacterized protein n=1 Tax=Flavobacterium pectinovorum TaxID=29533 RepID=A0AB36P647_9FLAO|nr:hypothetical protein [Flavobacterium pectinovorum]OXB07817.1 hypothetical protein B0A72_02830 [Flavobacterium pectinovorum]SHM81456.1 hypothetical protein SAMN05444387_3271 [Flavobacterium pectinovorum]
MDKVIFIASLHRPFSQQLKTTKWVCDFIASSKTNIQSSQLNLEFYYYLINILYKEYQRETPTEFNGLPSDSAVYNIYEYLKTKSKTKFIEEIPGIIKSRNTALERQIYSTYKAASYFVNLAKDKFGLVDDKNKLTYTGNSLIAIRSNFYKLSTVEKEFFFVRILEADFHLFLTLCLFNKLEKKYSLKGTIDEQLDFIDKFLKISHFKFTSASLSNYNIVRTYWAEIIGVLNSQGNIRKKYIDIINDNEKFRESFLNLSGLFLKFEKENFKSKISYHTRKAIFVKSYKNCLKQNISDLGYINLYDIKQQMRISSQNFQVFLAEFYELEKNNLSIFFNNTVNSIDRRERFYIRNRPVIKIKIK